MRAALLLLALAACGGASLPAPELDAGDAAELDDASPVHCRSTYWITVCGDAPDPTYDAGHE